MPTFNSDQHFALNRQLIDLYLLDNKVTQGALESDCGLISSQPDLMVFNN